MYYTIGRSDELKIIGYYPQTEYKKGYNPKSSNGHWRIKQYDFPDFLPNLELELNKDANRTDFLHFLNLSFGMIVSKEMRKVLTNHDLPRHHFYPIKVHHKGKVLEYFWFHYIIDDFWNLLNKENSYAEVAKIGMPITIEGRTLILSRNQIIEEQEKYKIPYNLRIGELTMKKEFLKYDLYRIECLGYHTIVSESLKNALIESGLTGFELKPFDRIKVEDSVV